MAGYDEFGLFRENAEEARIPWRGDPSVRREAVAAPSGRSVSALVWGDGPADVVFLHGGAQNAHTWDTVSLALDRPVVAVDLPGHGRSEWRDDSVYTPASMRDDVAAAIEGLAPEAGLVVGMSLGGLTALAVGAARPDLVRNLLLVDITPGVDRDKSAQITAFIRGPEVYESFETILARTVEFNPTRSVAGLRRGILHNALELPDGSWTWRYDRRFGDHVSGSETAGTEHGGGEGIPGFDLDSLWEAIGSIEGTVTLAKGGRSPVVGDDDLAELALRRPDSRLVRFPESGHSIQGDEPLALADLVASLLA